MRLVFILFALGLSGCAKAVLPGGDDTCALKNDIFILNFGQTKVPTYAAVVLPDGRLLRLRYGPEQIDTLGPDYDKGALSLPVGELVGINNNAKREKVFTMPGTYRFVMQDANTAEGMDLHKLECEVAFRKAT
jgi:hypothetical protein